MAGSGTDTDTEADAVVVVSSWAVVDRIHRRMDTGDSILTSKMGLVLDPCKMVIEGLLPVVPAEHTDSLLLLMLQMKEKMMEKMKKLKMEKMKKRIVDLIFWSPLHSKPH